MIINRRNLSLASAATLLLALGLFGCGGGGGNDPMTGGVQATPEEVDLSNVTPGFRAGAGTVQVAAGQSVVHGDIEFSCAAGGADCTVELEVSTDGALNATSTGGMVTAINSTAYDDRIATMHPVVGEWAGDWPGGARTVLTITSVSSDGQVTGTYRHQERGGQPFVLDISPDGPVTASLQNGVLSFSYGQSTFDFTQTAEDTFSFTFQFNPDAQMVSIVVDRQDADGMMPTDVPSAEALANVIDLVANDSRQDALGNYISGWSWRSANLGGAQQAAVSGTHRGGGYAQVIVSHDDSGQLQHNVSVWPTAPLQAADPWITAARYINTYQAPEVLDGVTRSTRPISDHGLGQEWQVTELTADYDDGGTLDIYVATDAQPSDGALDPFQTASEADHNIELPGVPALPASKDFMVVWIADDDSIDGSLDGVAGSFSCANAEGCSFVVDHLTAEDYTTSSTGVSFTPDDGSAQPVNPVVLGTVPRADYLAFGHWLYIPEDLTDTVNYEFGVFASGGDPFEAANLAGLTGTAIYEGEAVGMYYVDGLTDSPTVGSFTADVALTADFGDSNAAGFIDGEVKSFEFEDDVASSLPTSITLTASPYDYQLEYYGVQSGTTNIFHTSRSDLPAPFAGGDITGAAQASVDETGWHGEWNGVFYGNGSSATDHPTSVAGTFNVSEWDDYNRVGNGLTGSFGAHRQEQ
ncbi:MAG: hypothetical protein OXT64_14575 [Gammaproteobacteria bacterium]|nr:hypothetical protein [Gammaproteobacteria bacterium]